MAARGHATVDAGVIEQEASILTLTLPVNGGAIMSHEGGSTA